MVLGARPEEYNPSDEELIESHLGEVIMELLQHSSPQDLAPIATLLKNSLKFRKITITHMD